MICGAKRYIVKFETENQLKKRPIIAKSPASARRFVRGEYGRHVTILSVRRVENTRP